VTTAQMNIVYIAHCTFYCKCNI